MCYKVQDEQTFNTEEELSMLIKHFFGFQKKFSNHSSTQNTSCYRATIPAHQLNIVLELLIYFSSYYSC